MPGLGGLPSPPTMDMVDAPMGPINDTTGARNAPTPILISHVGRLITAAPTRTLANSRLHPQGGQINRVGFNLNDDNVVHIHDEQHRDLIGRGVESRERPSDPVDATKGVRGDGMLSRLPIFQMFTNKPMRPQPTPITPTPTNGGGSTAAPIESAAVD